MSGMVPETLEQTSERVEHELRGVLPDGIVENEGHLPLLQSLEGSPRVVMDANSRHGMRRVSPPLPSPPECVGWLHGTGAPTNFELGGGTRGYPRC